MPFKLTIAGSHLPCSAYLDFQVDMSPTRSYGGSGLGLAISKKLCEAMAGDMWVESPGLGQGSTFTWTVIMQAPRVQLVQRHRRMSVAVTSNKPQWVRKAGMGQNCHVLQKHVLDGRVRVKA